MQKRFSDMVVHADYGKVPEAIKERPKGNGPQQQ